MGDTSLYARLQEFFSLHTQGSNAPIVIYASLWPFSKVFAIPQEQLCADFTSQLLEQGGANRDLLMPSFASGFKDGICNLDTEKSTTGVLSEYFRTLPTSKRTLSAFFSFNIIGPHQTEVCSLMPSDAWGDGSVYEWLEKQNAHFFMLGIHPSHCSYLHRMEWLARDCIPYRYVKSFEGVIIREGKEEALRENLYVRTLDPVAVNDFTVLLEPLKNHGLHVTEIEKIPVSHIRAHGIVEGFLPLLQRDPLLVVKNRSDFER